jgi:hypothetical protein
MKVHPVFLIALFALSACNSADQSVATNGAGNAVQRASSPEAIAAVKAQGKTGLWADVAGVCAGKHSRATLQWNVQAPPDGVALYLLGGKGNGRLVVRGAAVGAKKLGPWLRPGMIFVLRAEGTQQELSRLVIGEKHC